MCLDGKSQGRQPGEACNDRGNAIGHNWWQQRSSGRRRRSGPSYHARNTRTDAEAAVHAGRTGQTVRRVRGGEGQNQACAGVRGGMDGPRGDPKGRPAGRARDRSLLVQPEGALPVPVQGRGPAFPARAGGNGAARGRRAGLGGHEGQY